MCIRDRYNPDWEKEGVVATVQNRDSRLGIFTKKPGDVNYYGDDGTPSICQISLIFGDAGSLATTGYIVKKGKHYSDVYKRQYQDLHVNLNFSSAGLLT